MSNKLLLDERPLVIQPSLATKIGLNEALFVQQLHYWLQKSSHHYDGRTWVYNTYDDWQEQFPFWGRSTIIRVVNKLSKQGIILIGNYNKHKMDKTNWYSIDYENLYNSPSTQNECIDCENPQTNDHYGQMDDPKPAIQECDLGTAIPEITTEITTEKEEKKEEEGKELENPILLYQNNIGTMSPIVLEDMNVWINDPCFDDGTAIVCEAIRTAARNAAYRWKYIDSVLRDWSKRNLRTIEQVQAHLLEVERAREQQRNADKNRSTRSKTVLQSKLPASVQRQLERERQQEQQGAPVEPKQKRTIMDDPYLKEQYEKMKAKRDKYKND
ncbi:DnaD domain protein [Brevibacillus laterosporus]|uniref:DnaD domain-containing protein n=1 Tax=Brevibacillus laterosporus TaxID=1465 RepID=UPI003D1B438D